MSGKNHAGTAGMFKRFWKKWTIDKPAAFGDLLWDVLVVQLAAFLDRLTMRRVIALIPVVILIVAYAHSIPIPPELMLVGDLLAYIDIFSVILLLSILSRVSASWIFTRQAAEHAIRLASKVLVGPQRFNLRRGREGKVTARKRLTGRTRQDDEYPAVGSLAWA
jgi:hypothetical protein